MHPSSDTVLPQPFAWIHIPAGEVTLIAPDSKWRSWGYIPRGTSERFRVDGFEIAKYPLTNAQFAEFIQAGGYNQQQWWTEDGWQLREENGWTEPLFWREAKWNRSDYPVVGVSWYEAAAFCRWLSDYTQEYIGLPTEWEWQRAGQGDSNRVVAWDVEEEDDDIPANWDGFHDISHEGGTTPVTQYEGKADSPYGVVDMTGNVWEWCRTQYKTGQNRLSGREARIAKGGGWVLVYSHEINIALTDRYSLYPHHRLDYLGFRCARYPDQVNSF